MSFGGRRGRGRGGFQYDDQEQKSPWNKKLSFKDGPHSQDRDRSSRPKPPPHIRGRALGLWYRDQQCRVNQQKQEEADEEIRNNFSCTLTSERQDHLVQLIDSLNQTDYRRDGARAYRFQKKYQRNLERNDTMDNEQKLESDDNEKEGEFTKLFKIRRSENLDQELLEEFAIKQTSKRYKEMKQFRATLPSYKCKQQIVDLVENHQVVIISGETGCGKTTQVAQFILDSEIQKSRASHCNIICTQPRRISAITVAERVAQERDEKIGNSVGYCIRLENVFPSKPAGKITFMTTGIVFQIMRDNANLDNVSHLILDEVHERSIHSDFLMTIVRDLLPRRPSLKLILMSATMNATEFSNYFGGAPITNIPGFTHPITEFYLEDAIEHTRFTFEDRRVPAWKRYTPASSVFEEEIVPYVESLRDSGKYSASTINELLKPVSEELNLKLIADVTKYICDTDETRGAILIFVTGWADISALTKELEASGHFPRTHYKIFPLHSMMPTVNQREIFAPPPPHARKIVIATQIAETSITIDDILWVIDGGKIKLGNFDLENNFATLDVEWVSLANAQQRRGRAGRVRAGNVYHLFSRGRKTLLDAFKKPEILRTRLEEVILQIKVLNLGSAEKFLRKLLDPPSEQSIQLALERLRDLHALDAVEEKLTPLGFHLAQLPMDPQTGKMILMGAIFSCADPIFSIAASLSFKDPFYRPLGKEEIVDSIRREYAGTTKSDHMVIAFVIRDYEKALRDGWDRRFCSQKFLSENTVNMLINMKDQFAGYLTKLGFLENDQDYKARDLNLNSNNMGVVGAILASGLYPNVAQVKYVGRSGRVSVRCGLERVKIHPGSVNVIERKFESPYLVYHKKMRSSNIFLYDTSMVNPFALIFFGGHLQWQEEGEVDRRKTSVLVDSRHNFAYPHEQNFRYFVESLRKELDEFFEYKVNCPGPTDWNERSKEGCLLRAIIELLTSEYQIFRPTAPENDEDDSDNGGTPSYRSSQSHSKQSSHRPRGYTNQRRRYY